MTTDRLSGIHHVSAVSAHIGQSHDFYTRVLGLRPLIKTVNQDDPSMYHLFFGDGAGSPGSDMTIFDIPGAISERRGNNSISLTTFRVGSRDTLEYWATRFDELGISHGGVIERDGRNALDFEDVVGTQLSLVDDGGAGESFPWDESPVPAAHQLRGLGYIVITVPDLAPTAAFLTLALGLRHDHVYRTAEYDVHVYRIGEGGAHAEVHVRVQPDLPRARHGSGGVHHVALRIPGDQEITDWIARLDHAGFPNSGLVDRHYFKSAYVREPNLVLFELATDGPGFEVDGPMDAEKLSLPPFLEPRRAQIESSLKPLGV
jgi:glyoxalase family protein